MKTLLTFLRLVAGQTRVTLRLIFGRPPVADWTASEQRMHQLIRSFLEAANRYGLVWIRSLESRALSATPAARAVPLEELEVAGVPTRVLRGGDVTAPERSAVLYLHGGGYCIGSADTHLEITARLARELEADVYVPNYRLAPESPYPAAQDDCLAVYAQIAQDRNGGKIAIAGDSAGGGLTFATLLGALESGLPQPAAAIFFSPWFAPQERGGSILTNAEFDTLDATFLDNCRDAYVSDTAALRDPRFVAPLARPEELELLAPALIQVGDIELFLDQSRDFAEQWSHAGGDVHFESWPKLFHTYQNLVPTVPRADPAVVSAVDFLRARL